MSVRAVCPHCDEEVVVLVMNIPGITEGVFLYLGGRGNYYATIHSYSCVQCGTFTLCGADIPKLRRPVLSPDDGESS